MKMGKYAFRQNFVEDEPTMISFNCIQFLAKFVVKNEKLHIRKSDVVVQTFPRYSSSPKSSNYPLYCKYQLLKYKPWSGNPSSAWNNEDDSDEVFVTHWNNFLHEPNINQYVPQWNTELANISTYYVNLGETGQVDESSEAAEPEEWMLLSNRHMSRETLSESSSSSQINEY